MNNRRNGLSPLRRKKKAVSPMIASVLLIMFVIALSTIIVNWLKGYAKDQTEATDIMTDANTNCIKQNIRINTVWMMKNSSSLDSTVRLLVDNSGSVSANVSSVEVFTIYGESCTLASSTGSDTVGAGDQIIWENTSCAVLYDGGTSVNNCTSKFTEIRATTTCGNTHVFTDSSKVKCQVIS